MVITQVHLEVLVAQGGASRVVQAKVILAEIDIIKNLKDIIELLAGWNIGVPQHFENITLP
jgi:hypothetical protein